MGPLFGLLALAAGAGGQDWYFNDRAKKGQNAVRGLLGRAPGVADDNLGGGPPDPGMGLLADPADTRRQLEFAAGMMGMEPRERRAAQGLFGDIMGRASQAALSREGWGRQEAAASKAAAIHEANVDRRWQVDNAAIDSRFQSSHQLAQDQFAQDKLRYGETQAWERYKFGEQQRLAWRQDAREEASNRRAEALKGAQLAALQEGAAKMPVGYERVMVGGPNGARVVARPVEGTPDWTKAQEDIDSVSMLRHNIAAYADHLKAHGTEQVGAGAGTQRQLWARITGAIGKLDKLGTLNVGDLERIKGELPDPTEIMRMPVSLDRIHAQLAGLDQQAAREQEFARDRFAGWGLRMPDPAAPAPGGRDSPPEGSVPFGRGRALPRARGERERR